MLRSNPHMTYHQRQLIRAKEEGRRLDEIELMCLTDGRRVKFLDDGPWQHTRIDGNGEGTPMNPGRARIVQNLRKRDADGFPIWVSEKPGIRIFDFQINEYREVPVLDDAARKRMEKHLQVHAERMKRGQLEAKVKLEEAARQKAASDEAAVVAALAKVLGKANADEKKAEKVAPKGGA